MSTSYDDPIKGFSGRFSFLGNYHTSEVGLDSVVGATVEHVYQAMKSRSPSQRRFIASRLTPNEAKQAGRATEIREDWDDIRVEVMEALVREKFLRHRDLRTKLLATGNRYLEETNDWGDSFWGVCNGEGRNILGQILMNVRDELRETGLGHDENREVFESVFDQCLIRMKRGSRFETAPFPTANVTKYSRIEGMMLGLAIGDSLGNTSESMNPKDRFLRYGEIRDYLPNRYADGRRVGLPSDDTQLAYWTLESILEQKRFNPEVLAGLLADGRRIFGLGSAVRQFLRNFKKEVNPCWYRCSANAAGNGALMRIAPMVIHYVRRPCSGLWVDTALSALVTHNDSASLSACVTFIDILWKALGMSSSPDPEWWLRSYVESARNLETGAEYRPRGGEFQDYHGPLWAYTEQRVQEAYDKGLSAVDACNSWHSGAYLMETVPSVLFILMKHGHDFEEAVVRAVNDTRDNDTVGAIVGAAVGALHGKEAIPKRWIDNLLGRTSKNDDGRVFRILNQAHDVWWSRNPIPITAPLQIGSGMPQKPFDQS